MIYFLIIFSLLYLASGAAAMSILAGTSSGAAADDVKTKKAAAEKKRRDKKQKEAEEDEAAFRKSALSEQCFLLDNYKALRETPQAVFPAITQIVGNPAQVYSRLTARAGLSALIDIRNDELALLVPKIRFFKQKYKDYKDPSTGRRDPLMDPNGEPIMEELVFSDFYNKSNTKSVLGETAIYSGVGIKSIDYELKGGNPQFGTTSMQDITITFWMDSIAALAKKVGSGPAFVDLISDPSQHLKEVDNKGKVKLTNELNPAYRTLHMLYGWAVPPASVNLIRPAVRDALNTAQVMLRLQLISPTIDLQQDGTATLTLKYTAWQEATKATLKKDVLKLDPKYRKQIEAKEREHTKATEKANSENQGYRASIESQKKRLSGGDNSGTLSPDNKEQFERKEKHASAQEKKSAREAKLRQLAIKKLKLHARETMYRAFLEKLEKDGKVFFVEVPMKEYEKNLEAISDMEDLRQRSGYANMTDAEKKAYDEERASYGKPPSLRPKRVTDRGRSGGVSTARKAQDEHFKHQRASNEAEAREGRLPDPKSAFAGKAKSKKKKSAEMKRVYFMRYGDIINTVMQALSAKPRDPILAMGPIVWTDPRTNASQSEVISNIPISMELFLVWWIKEVVTQNKDTYLLNEFIKSSAGSLIVGALGGSCFQGTPVQTPRVSISLIDNIKGTGKMKPPLERGKIYHLNDIPIKSGPDTPGGPFFSYIYVFVHSFILSELIGDKPKDSEKGIYHFSVGNSKGLVKEISFKRTDNQLMESARVLRNMADDPNDEIGLGRLHSQYNADLTLVGNSLFKPAQFIYINPSIRGLGDIRMKNSIARRLGLGGYFMVTKVGGTIDSGGWTTNLSATWQSHGGFGKGAPVKADTSTTAKSSTEPSPSEKSGGGASDSW